MKKVLISLVVIASSITGAGTVYGVDAAGTEESYLRLRDKIFTEPRAGRNEENIESNELYAIIFETADEETIITLTAMKDGTVKLYSSAGECIIVKGKHRQTAQQCRRFFVEGGRCIRHTGKTLDKSLPEKGETTFYFLTVNRDYRFRDRQTNFTNVKSPLSKLYQTALELTHEARRLGKAKKT